MAGRSITTTWTARDRDRLRIHAIVIVVGSACGGAYSFALFGGIRDLLQGLFIGGVLGTLLGAFEIFGPTRPFRRRLREASFIKHFAVRALIYLATIVGTLEVSSMLFTGRPFAPGHAFLGHVAVGVVLSAAFNFFFSISRSSARTCS